MLPYIFLEPKILLSLKGKHKNQNLLKEISLSWVRQYKCKIENRNVQSTIIALTRQYLTALFKKVSTHTSQWKNEQKSYK